MIPEPPRSVSRGLAALLIAAIVVLAAVACGGDEASPASSHPGGTAVTAVTTLPVFADFIRQAGGDRVGVYALMPDGLKSIPRSLSSEQAEWLGAADVVLYNGIDLESTMEDILFVDKRRGSQLISYAKDIDSPTVEGLSASQARENPYLWMDPVFGASYLGTTWDSLAIVDGEGASTYEANADRYNGEIVAVHQDMEQRLKALPEEKRKMVAFHPAFVHLARRYGLDLVEFPRQVSTDEPSPRRVEEWVETIQSEGVSSVFTARGDVSPLLKAAARSAGVQVCELYVDVLDDKVSTYVEMMQFNADELVRCLGGD